MASTANVAGDSATGGGALVKNDAPPIRAESAPQGWERWLTDPAADRGPGRAASRLLAATSPAEVWAAWAAVRVASEERPGQRAISDRLAADIAALDVAIAEQLDAVLHHPRFQQLEASWRSLHWLVHRVEPGGGGRTKVRVLNAAKRELARDFERAIDFDRSAIWREVYDQQFDMPGGEPFGLLVADMTIDGTPDDRQLLAALSGVAAAAFAPLVAAPGPTLLGIDSMTQLDRLPQLDVLHGGPEFAAWRSLRAAPDSRFVGLVLPRILARLPYDGWIRPPTESQPEAGWQRRGFRYREEVEGPAGGRRLWTSAAWAFASVVIAEFERSGWFADIRGASRGAVGGGVVEGLPVEGFGISGGAEARRGPLDVQVTGETEGRLADAGFVPLVADGGPGRAVFHSNQSLHKPVRYQSADATANAKLAAMLQYMLCASRFAHYVKQLGRDRMGAFADAESLKDVLTEWLQGYVTPNDNASPAARAEMPLRAADVEVQEEPGSPGCYRLQMRLQPHFQLDEVVASVHFAATLRSR
jgi:type VI secretion system ImpC/EvpB family protein